MRKLFLLPALIGLTAGVTAYAADPLICTISECKGFAPNAPLALRGQQLNNWARSELWGFTEEVLQAVGLQANFDLIETDVVPNAAAVIYEKKRVLAYNPQWLKAYDRTSRWLMYGLLAHEIGHHLQGHTLLEGGSKPPTELEADSFAGFVLGKLGATEADAISLWLTLPASGSSSHPGQSERVGVVRQGWRKATGAAASSKTPVPEARSDGFVLPDSSTRLLAARDIELMSPVMLRIARNEIFARQGFAFESPDLQSYFGGRTWYQPRGRNVALSQTEKANVDLIRQRETALGGEKVEKGVVFMHSSVQRLTREEVQKLALPQRRLARNEIFARNGYIFNDPQLAAHFGKMSWYRPIKSSVELNPVEDANVRLLRSME